MLNKKYPYPRIGIGVMIQNDKDFIELSFQLTNLAEKKIDVKKLKSLVE